MDGGADRVSDADAGQSSGGGEHHGFDEELPDDVLAAGADGFADTDLAGALGDADQHDVHHADAADHQPDGSDHDDGKRDHAHDTVEAFNERSRGLEVEVVGLVVGHLAGAAQRHARLVDGHVQLSGKGLDADAVFLGLGIHLAEGPVGNDGARIAVVGAAKTALRFLEDAQYLEVLSADQDVLADGIDVGKEALGEVFANHHDGHAVLVLRLGKASALRDHGVGIHGEEVGGGAAEVEAGDLFAFVARPVQLAVEERDGHVGARLAEFAHGEEVVVVERLALALFLAEASETRPAGQVREECGVGAVALDGFLNALVESHEHGDDGDQGRHRN